ncbi:MAG: alpha/beta fold hydrolase [Candidatus Rokubacteria bacterium]|nr:alpha/beta fold hydrolase [Candidatus Rokubacteria bacterium]
MQDRVVRFVLSSALALGLTLGAGTSAAAAPDPTACGQSPGQRFFWVERAFRDIPLLGPARAQGVVIWNHGIHGTNESWRDPAPPVLRLLAARGWDVVILKRHNLAETDAAHSLYRAVTRTRDEIRAQRALGYTKIVLAGQSFGGQVALDAAEHQPDVFAVVAFAPGMRAKSADGILDAAVTERQLSRIHGAARLALVLPGDDGLFGGVARGPGADAALRARGGPYVLLDESSDARGHTGATSGRFALRIGESDGGVSLTWTSSDGRTRTVPLLRGE